MEDDVERRFDEVHKQLAEIKDTQVQEQQRVTGVESAMENLRGSVSDLKSRIVDYQDMQSRHHTETIQKLDAIKESADNSWPGKTIKWVVGTTILVLSGGAGIALVIVSWLHK